MSSRRLSSRVVHTPGSLKEAESSDDEMEQEKAHAEEEQPAEKRAKKEPKAPQIPETLAPMAPGAVMLAPPRRKKFAAGAAAGNMTLMELLAKYPEEAGHNAKAWVTRYSEDQTTATAELLTLLVQAAGVSYTVSNEEVEEGDADELASRLRAMVMEDGGFEPFSNKRTAKGMKVGFPAFWGALIEELHGAECLVSPTTGNTDDFALEKVKDLAVALSLQVVRPFRLAATLCAAQLVSSMVGVRTQLLDALAQVIQQRDAEQKKGARANKTTLATVQRQVDSYHRQDDSINAWVDGVIKSVFAVRFRDVAPSIRALVISSFGQWIMAGPATFLSDAYLKYLGWALSDRDASVRSAAVGALRNLYSNPGNIAGMRDFTGRFLGRMTELPYDVSDTVAAAGMELLATLVQLQELGHGQMQDVYGLLADESPLIREAAASLAAKMLRAEAEERDKAQPASQAAGKRGRGVTKKGAKAAGQQQRDAHTIDVAVLLDVMSWMQTDAPLSPQAVALLVDSLYDHFPAVRDGSALAGALEDEDLVDSPMHAVHAAMLLASSLQRAQQGSTGGVGKAAGPRAKAAAPDSAAHQDTSLFLIGSLPALIRKHQTQANVVAPLCQAVRLLHLELFALRNEERAFGDLLNLVADQVFRHAGLHVATQVVDTLMFCSKMGPGALQPIARLVLSTVVSKAAQGLGAAGRAVLKLPDQVLQAEVEELHSAAAGPAPEGAAVLWRLKVSLTRVQALLSRGAWLVSSQATSVWECVAQLLDRCGSDSGRGLMGVEVTSQVVHVAYTTIMARLAQLKQASEEGHCVNAVALAPATNDGDNPGKSGAGSGSKRAAPATRGKTGTKKARAGQKDGAEAARGAVEGMDKVAEEDEAQIGEGGSEVVSMEGVKAQAGALAQKLVAVYNAAEGMPIIQVVINRAMVDLLLLFGHNTWKGTPMEGCRLQVGPEFLDCCWLGCSTALTLSQDALLSAEPTDSQENNNGMEDKEYQGNRHVRALQRRLLAVGGIARLLLSPSLLPEQRDSLAIRLLAQFTTFGPEVEELVRDIAVELRRRKQQSTEQQQGVEKSQGLTMAELNVEALKCSFKDVLEALLPLGTEEGYSNVDMDCLSQALHAFNENASALASMYAGVGLSRNELLALMRGGARYALAAQRDGLEDAMPRMYFLAWGLEPFVPKLLPQDAAQLVGEVESLAKEVAATLGFHGLPSMKAQADSQGYEEEEEEEEDNNAEWTQYKHFMDLLRARASKAETDRGRVRGAMKGARARLATSTPAQPCSPAPDQQALPAPEHQLNEEERQPQEQGEQPPLISQQQQRKQQQAMFGQRETRQPLPTATSSPSQPAPSPPALADEEPLDMSGTLLDGSAPLSEDAQLPRARQSQLLQVRSRQEAMSGEGRYAEEVEVEGLGSVGKDVGPAPSQVGTQTTTQTASEPPPRALRRRRV